MFFFGDNSVAVDYYFQKGIDAAEGRLKDQHFDEMGEKDLRVAVTCLRIAIRDATEDNASEDILEALESAYEEVFTLLCYESKQYREFSLRRFGADPKNKYYLIALSAN